MNKRQKEVAQHHLDAEKKVLKELEKQYKTALDDINKKIAILQSDELTQSRIYRLEHQHALKAQVQAVLDKLHSDEYGTISQFLTNTYGDAWVGTAYDLFGWGVPIIMPVDPAEAVKAIQTDSQINGTLYDALGVDVKRLKKSISGEITRGLAGGMSTNEIARNISNATKAPLSRARTIVRTESHRIQQASCYNAQKAAKSKGANVVKQWDSTMDGDTRPTHRQLDGQIREVEEPFEMDGKSAMYPGDFGDPAEDCNCRCQSLQRAKWALDESELQTLKDRAEFFGLDKTEDFEDFKKKYLKAVENTTKSGIIKLKNSELENGLPLKGIADSIVDKIDDGGKTLQRRIYGKDGMAETDFDTSDHGLPKAHPTGAHKHTFNHDKKKPRGKPLPLTDEELKKNEDIIQRGVNYRDEG